MSRRPQLSRQVPADSVKQFNDWCESEGHVNGGDKGRCAEQAIIEYLPPEYRPERFRDDLDALEADLRTDLDEVEHLNDGSSSNRTLTSTPNDETVKLTYRIAEDVQNKLEEYVYDQEGKVRGVIGEYVAASLDEYRDGGQAARVRRYYEQLRESVDLIPENRIESIVETLRDNTGVRDSYHIEEIRLAVDKSLDVHSNDVRSDFVDRVIEHLGFVSVQTADGMYATQARAEQFVQEHEIDGDTKWYLMDKNERVEYLAKALKARSRQKGGSGVDYNQVRDEIFNGNPSDDYCYKLMKLAGKYSGFKYESHNGKLKLRYLGRGDSLLSESVGNWQTIAVEHLKDFCNSSGIDPTELSESILNNRIARAKYPEEYTKIEEAEGSSADDVGVSDRALEAVTETDREEIRSHLFNDDPQAKAGMKQEMDRNTSESEPVTDGGQSGK